MAQSAPAEPDVLALALAALEELPIVSEAQLLVSARDGVIARLLCEHNHLGNFLRNFAEQRQLSKANPTLAACAVSLLDLLQTKHAACGRVQP